MKKCVKSLLTSVLLFLLFVGVAGASYTASPSSTTNGGGTWDSILKMAISISGNQATFTITKKDGTRFTKAGNNYLKVGCYDTSCVTHSQSHRNANALSVTLTDNLCNYTTGWPKDFYARIENDDGSGYAWVGKITISNNPLNAPSLSSPANNATNVSVTPTLSWGSVSEATNYKVQVCKDSNFSNPIEGIGNFTSFTISESEKLETKTLYYWRVRAGNDCTGGNWSSVRSFTTVPVTQRWYKDEDNDRYSNGQYLDQPTRPNGYKLPGELTSTTGDCNDSNANINPGATEICDGVDNNCNNQVDEGVKNTYYKDADGDGYGNSNNLTQACSCPSGYVSNSTDCNDSNANIHPGATEICGNGIDENCTNGSDEGCVVISKPSLISPANNSLNISITPNLQYSISSPVDFFNIKITNVSTGQLVYETTTSSQSHTVPSGKLLNDIEYKWQVRGGKGTQTGDWSDEWRFRTIAPDTTPPSSLINIFKGDETVEKDSFEPNDLITLKIMCSDNDLAWERTRIKDVNGNIVFEDNSMNPILTFNLQATNFETGKYIVEVVTCDKSRNQGKTEELFLKLGGPAYEYYLYLRDRVGMNFGGLCLVSEDSNTKQELGNNLVFEKAQVYYQQETKTVHWDTIPTKDANGEFIMRVYPLQESAISVNNARFVFTPYVKDTRVDYFHIQFSEDSQFNTMFFDSFEYGGVFTDETFWNIEPLTASRVFEGRFYKKLYWRVVGEKITSGYKVISDVGVFSVEGKSGAIVKTNHISNDFYKEHAVSSSNASNQLKTVSQQKIGVELNLKTVDGDSISMGIKAILAGVAIGKGTSIIEGWLVRLSQRSSSLMKFVAPEFEKMLIRNCITPFGILVRASGWGLVIWGVCEATNLCEFAFKTAFMIINTVIKEIFELGGDAHEGLSGWQELFNWIFPTAYADLDEDHQIFADFEIFLRRYMDGVNELTVDQLKYIISVLNSYSDKLIAEDGTFNEDYIKGIEFNKIILKERAKSSNFYIRSIARYILKEVPDQISEISVVEGKTVQFSNTPSNLKGISSNSDSNTNWYNVLGKEVELSDRNNSSPYFVAPITKTEGTKLGFFITENKGGEEYLRYKVVNVVDNGITDFDKINYDLLTTYSHNSTPIAIEVNQGKLVKWNILNPKDLGYDPNKFLFLNDLEFHSNSEGVAIFTIFLAEPAPEDYKVLKHTPDLGFYEYSNVVFDGGRKALTITLYDGGNGDDDGEVNGIIVDPSGIGSKDAGETTTTTTTSSILTTTAETTAETTSIENTTVSSSSTSTSSTSSVITTTAETTAETTSIENTTVSSSSTSTSSTSSVVTTTANTTAETSSVEDDTTLVSTSSTAETTTVAIENRKPYTPVLSSPENCIVSVELTPKLVANSFSDPDHDDYHIKSEWQISTDQNFTEIILNIQSDTLLTEFTVPKLVLNEGTEYFFRVKYFDSHDKTSEWSDPFSFITIITNNDTNDNGITDEQEVEPNVDLDKDLTPDLYQETIKSIKTAKNDAQVGIKSQSTATIKSAEAISLDSIIDDVNKPQGEMPFGLVGFKMTMQKPGDTDIIVIHLSKPASKNAKWYKFDEVKGWIDASLYAKISGSIIKLQCQDGGPLDADGVMNGIFIDPGGIVEASSQEESSTTTITTTTATTTVSSSGGSGGGGGGGGGGCFISTTSNENNFLTGIFWFFLAIIFPFVLKRR